MKDSCKACDPILLEHPQALFEELDRRGLLVPGPDLVVVVRRASEELLGVSELHEPFTELGCFNDDLPRALRDAGAGPWTREPLQKTAYLVRRRLGRTVPLPCDTDGVNAWLNARAVLDVVSGDWFLVTEHGWRALWSHTGPSGGTPRLHVQSVRGAA